MKYLFLLALPILGAEAQKLQVQQPALHQFDGGPNLPPASIFHDGETVYYTCSVSGYKASDKDQVHLEWQVEAVDDSGVALTKPGGGKVEAELAPEDKNWMPKIRFQFEVPTTASCDACAIRLRVKDMLGKTEASAETRLTIRSKAVEPSKELTVRNFRFLRGEEDGTPLAVPAYRPGDEVWARFEMTGYKIGENNRVHVEYGLSVYRPSGKPLYQEPKAAVADETSFYPKKYLPGVLSLKLDSKMPPGEYPIVLEVRDPLGPQRYEGRFTFRIE